MKKGFTLIETIVVIFVFGLLMGILSGMIVMLYRTHGYEWQQSMAVSEARRGIEIMTKEIRGAIEGENGSYPIEYAGDKEFIFYSDIDGDGRIERVRYFLGKIESQTLVQECQTSQKGGSCSVSFSNFFTGNLKSAQLKVSVQGDLGRNNEYIEIFADGQKLGTVCETGCQKCPGTWEGIAVYDVFSFAQDNLISFLAHASNQVDPICPFAMKVKFELSFTQETQGTELKKGVIEPVGSPPSYPLDQEKVSIITSYVRNAPPIFEYYDKNGDKIEDYPSRLIDVKMMQVFLVVNIDPNRPPNEFQLKSMVQLRNLKNE